MLRRSSHLSSCPANALIIIENNAKDGVFDPIITTSVSCSVFWECSNGYREVTTGTSHALSYTAPDSSPRRWVVRCAAGLGAITAIDCNTDAMTSIRGLSRTRMTSFYVYANSSLSMRLSDIPKTCISIISISASIGIVGTLSDLPSGLIQISAGNNGNSISGDISALSGTVQAYLGGTGVSGAMSSAPSTLQYAYFNGDTLITPASIAHLTAIRDLRIYSMGWSAAVTGIDVVVDSVYVARAAYTYASGIVLRYGGTDAIPSGTEGTTPPAAGVSNADWTWNAGSGQHEPQTPQAKMFIMQNDPYGEGFKGWTFTKV